MATRTINKSTNHHGLSFFLLCSLIAFGSAPLAAQVAEEPNVLEEVTVTALRREESIQDVAGAVTAFSSDAIDRMHIVTVEDIALRTPNFTMSEFNIAQPRLFIRGIGSTDDGAAQDNSVAVFLDEVYLARGGAQAFQLFDLERIEVLRGPQGTLYGKNVVGGVVNVITAKPQQEFAARGELSYGNYSKLQAKGMINGGVSDQVAVRVSFIAEDRDGYAENIVTGKEMEDRQFYAIRGQLLWEPSEKVSVLIAADHSDHKDNGLSRKGEGPFGPTPFGTVTAVLSSTDPRESESPRYPYQRRELSGISANISWETGIGDLTSITAYRESDVDLMDAFTGIGSPPYIVLDTANTEIETADQFSQEFRLAIESSDKLNTILGVYYLDESVDRTEISDLESVIGTLLPDALGSLTGSSASYQLADNSSLGVFASVTYDFSDRLSTTIGGRYTWEEKDIHTSVVSLRDVGCCIAAPPTEEYDVTATEDWDAFTPSFALEYAFSDQVNSYLSISKGFKSGGFQGQAPTGDAAETPFDPEYAWNYELGLKSMLLGRRLMLNMAVFYTDYSDLQVRQNAARPGEVIPILRITNAASAEAKGIEVEWNASLARGFNIWGSYGYLDTEYGYFIDNTGTDVTGNQLQFAPEHQFDFGARLSGSINERTELFGQVQYSWQDDYFTEPPNAPVHLIESYGLLNASFGVLFDDGKWRLEAWGRNLTDEVYQLHIIPFLGDRFATYGQPRTYWLTLAADF